MLKPLPEWELVRLGENQVGEDLFYRDQELLSVIQDEQGHEHCSGFTADKWEVSKMEILCSMEQNCNSLCWMSLENHSKSNTEFLLKTKKGSCEQVLLSKALLIACQ